MISAVCLCSCAPKYEEIKTKYKEDGYNVMEIPLGSATAQDLASLSGFELDKVGAMFFATKDTVNRVDVVTFNDGKEATAFYNKQKGISTPNFDVVKKGNTVIYGTEEAVDFIK